MHNCLLRKVTVSGVVCAYENTDALRDEATRGSHSDRCRCMIHQEGLVANYQVGDREPRAIPT